MDRDLPGAAGGEGGEVGLLDTLAAPLVDDQISGDFRQEAAAFAMLRHAPGHQQADEGVLRYISGLLAITQAPTQPAQQPAVVVAVEGFERL
jgi:hypothetical protein